MALFPAISESRSVPLNSERRVVACVVSFGQEERFPPSMHSAGGGGEALPPHTPLLLEPDPLPCP